MEIFCFKHQLKGMSTALDLEVVTNTVTVNMILEVNKCSTAKCACFVLENKSIHQSYAKEV